MTKKNDLQQENRWDLLPGAELVSIAKLQNCIERLLSQQAFVCHRYEIDRLSACLGVAMPKSPTQI
jgi:hypothetical protein